MNPDCGPKLATQMWARLKILIKHSRGKDQLDIITIDDVKRGNKMMNRGTALGIDQWSPFHWKRLSPEAMEAIAHLFNHVEKHGVWPGHIYDITSVPIGKATGGSRASFAYAHAV